MTRDDVGWGLAVALSVVLIVAVLPLVPAMWLAGRLGDRIG